MKNERNYYLGLDIGTDSVGYAVTDEKYNLIKFHGEPAWGVTIFDAASLSGERRTFRTARRRLDRRQQRVLLVQELFAKEIGKIDPKFYIRIKDSMLSREDRDNQYTLFNDERITDPLYYEKYPTIHHLILELMESSEPHDVRLVYLACAWLAAHRGHFLSNISRENLNSIKDFGSVYASLMSYFTDSDNGYDAPWGETDPALMGNIIKKKEGITAKSKALTKLLYGGTTPKNEPSESFPFNRACIVKLLAGGSCRVADVFNNDEYADFGSVSLRMDDDKLGELMAGIGEDYELIAALRSVTDWAILVDVLREHNSISAAKVEDYEKHKKDLATLKYFIRSYAPDKYDEVFRNKSDKIANYVAYSYHTNDGDTRNVKKKSIEEFSKYINGIIGNIQVREDDQEAYADMLTRLELREFMPKQKNTDNRVVPHQLYWAEMNSLLENASRYLPFLNEADDSGLTVKEKLLSIFLYRIPYFVGPLNPNSSHAWIVRKSGKIYPWNFDEMVDLDASEQQFIQRMTNSCTYLPGESVLPKNSLSYQKYMVLNEINNLRINREKISVELKQAIYHDLFMNVKKVTPKKITNYLICNGIIEKGEENCLSGIDINIKSSLSSQIAFKRLMGSGKLSVNDVERIIKRASYAEDKSRLSRWLAKEYPELSEEDNAYICRIKMKDFGRLSEKFLNELEGTDKETGEVFTIMRGLWETQNNLMELLSDKYTFMDEIRQYQKEYYSEHAYTLDDRLDEMYASNAVRRPIYRTLAIVKDIEKAFGAPKKIFLETTRGANPNQKGQRTKSRKQQIMELYQTCRDEDIRHLKQQLEAMGEYADNKLQEDKLFLYYLQLGKSMYSGETIVLDKLGTKTYNIDHIYPQAYVKDDSIINNKVLVLSSENGTKQDVYPIEEDIRRKMAVFWHSLKEHGLISEEKYKRLTRTTPFTDEERMNFINRQLTETSQSTKAMAQILQERYPDTEIVYSKARLISDFRQVFELYKSRTFNDLHHAADAYLNIVVGNVYDMKFSKRWFRLDQNYSIKIEPMFKNPVICGGMTVWDGTNMLQKVKKTAVRNTAHFTKYAFFKRGGLFDQQPVAKANGLVPLKKGMEPEKYGGYNKSGVMFFIPVKYKAGNKSEILIMSVEMLFGGRFLKDEAFAKEYSSRRLQHILSKTVEEISFPMGMRPWKVNTMLSLDGFKICIAGSGSGGKSLIAQPVMQFSDGAFWQFYLKKLEMFAKKAKKNANYIYDEEFDHVSVKKNDELYNIYLKKYESSIYRKRINSPYAILKDGKEKFSQLSILEQTQALLNIHASFGRVAGGCDLSLIGGGTKAAACNSFSSSVSNWAKKYKDVRLIDSSASGLWNSQSENILKLL